MAARAYELAAEAERELDEAIAFFEGAQSDRGLRFLASFELTIATIVRYPDIGRKLRRRVRVFSMTKWPYKIVYSLERDTILVWAVAHHKRKPGYWRHRMR